MGRKQKSNVLNPKGVKHVDKETLMAWVGLLRGPMKGEEAGADNPLLSPSQWEREI